jgi:hypothetical protein
MNPTTPSGASGLSANQPRLRVGGPAKDGALGADFGRTDLTCIKTIANRSGLGLEGNEHMRNVAVVAIALLTAAPAQALSR